MLRSLLFLACLGTAVRAADLHVPGDAPTIPAAIALAQAGDTILVGPGTWPGPVDFGGKPITVRATDGWAATLLDATGVPGPGVVLGAASGTAVLEGFSVTGAGTAQVLLLGAATVRRCVLRDGPGAGLLTSGTGAGARLLEDCWIAGNPGGGVRQAGLSTFLVVRRCLVEDNGSPALTFGGGLSGAALRAFDCIVRGNVAQQGGGGAGLTDLDGSLFVGNTATVRGGGYYEVGSDFFQGIVITNAAFVGNQAPDTGGVYLDPGSFAQAPVHALTGCVFAGNTDAVGNLGLWSDPVGDPGPGLAQLTHCTVLDNAVVVVGALGVHASIVRGGTLTASSVGVSYSDVEGGAPGPGNFDADPAFVDGAHGVYALLPGSPCVDAVPVQSDPDGSPQDAGAATLAPFCDARQALFGSLGLPGLTGQGTLQAGTPVALNLVRARAGAAAALVLGLQPLHAAFKGGVLVPQPLLAFTGLPVASDGALTLAGTWPSGVPSGTVAWAQFWIADAAGPAGFAASNGLGLVVP